MKSFLTSMFLVSLLTMNCDLLPNEFKETVVGLVKPTAKTVFLLGGTFGIGFCAYKFLKANYATQNDITNEISRVVSESGEDIKEIGEKANEDFLQLYIKAENSREKIQKILQSLENASKQNLSIIQDFTGKVDHQRHDVRRMNQQVDQMIKNLSNSQKTKKFFPLSSNASSSTFGLRR